ncbi:MAG TPA: hypothetical protein VGV13_20985 [Methylomirabilota bacterium]|nr:hypothetical protein [Methylomirabilota bacterium]
MVLKEIIPRLGRVVTFYNPGNTVAREAARLGREAARQLGVQLVERHSTALASTRSVACRRSMSSERTAREIGLTIPPPVGIRADRVIE